jgi:hypothetical protein
MIDLSDPCAVMEFMTRQMSDPNLFQSKPHLLSQNQLNISLSGRDGAICQAAQSFQLLIHPSNEKETRKIPICTGIPGLGKTRILEEWQLIFDVATIPSHPRLGILISYNNGFNPTPVEQRLNIEASFSWRLLYQVFVYGNCGEERTFKRWFRDFLPVNGDELTLSITLEVIQMKLSKLSKMSEGETLHLFIGVDEYQEIQKLKGTNIAVEEPLQTLIEHLGSLISPTVEATKIRIYPMFAGTDFEIISTANSSKTETIRLSMNLLLPHEIIKAIESIPEASHFLRQKVVVRHLFFLGGLPRWTIEYIKGLKEIVKHRFEKNVTIDEAEDVFKKIEAHYTHKWSTKFNLDAAALVMLAAYSISAFKIFEGDKNIGGISWKRLRDGGVCLLNDGIVTVPYPIIHQIYYYNPRSDDSEAIVCFISCVKDLVDKIDTQLYDKTAWMLWEDFGAYFHALRINAFLIIRKYEIKVKELFNGAMVNGCDIEVLLKPMKVKRTRDRISDQLKCTICEKDNVEIQHNWLEDGLVVINGESGQGVDIFFSLKTVDGKIIVITDQRKRDSKKLGTLSINTLLEKAKIIPNVDHLLVIPCLFSVFANPRISSEDLLLNSVFVCSKQSSDYFSLFRAHPAASPFIFINDTTAIHLGNLLSGTNKIDVAKNILKRKYRDFDELDEAVKNAGVSWTNIEEVEDCIVFSG